MNSADIRHSFRSDIQGLRGVAVIFVIIGHVYPSVLPGGFIGVDVFFVISGYVITEQLKSLWFSNQKNLLASFYARRILRIFPSALIVVLTTVLATRVLLGPVFGADAATDGFWSTVFLANFHFAALSQDYFASGIPQSTMQHYWSLSIEEQFYLLWPLIFILLAKYASVKRYQLPFVGALLLGSFAFCIANLYHLNGQNFFNSGARAWQLLAGCLLALICPGPKNFLIVRFIALGTLLVTAVTLDQTMEWPSLTSLLVVVSGVLLCYPIKDQRVLILDTPPLKYVGDISFLLYLWHWPILIIAKNYFPSFEIRHTALVLSLTLSFSAVTHKFFERPIRQNQTLIQKPRVTIFSGVMLLIITAIAMRSL